MVAAIVHNIRAELTGGEPSAAVTWNAVCLADAGNVGIGFVALSKINTTWAKKGKWVHLPKIAFENYFLHKVRSRNTDPVCERCVLNALGFEQLRSPVVSANDR